MQRLAAVGLIVLSASYANAQQSQGPQFAAQFAPCFDIQRNTTSGAAGALMVNKCTGDTWILITSNPPRWHPISKAKTEYMGPQ